MDEGQYEEVEDVDEEDKLLPFEQSFGRGRGSGKGVQMIEASSKCLFGATGVETLLKHLDVSKAERDEDDEDDDEDKSNVIAPSPRNSEPIGRKWRNCVFRFCSLRIALFLSISLSSSFSFLSDD